MALSRVALPRMLMTVVEAMTATDVVKRVVHMGVTYIGVVHIGVAYVGIGVTGVVVAAGMVTPGISAAAAMVTSPCRLGQRHHLA
jgi:hypothetical protein